MDFKDLAAKLGIDEEDFIELVELFVTTTISDIEKIKQGVQDNNPENAAAASHSIKGAAGNLGFNDMYTLAMDMEMKAKQGSLENFESYITDLEAMVNTLNAI